MTTKLSADEKSALTYIRLAATAITEGVHRLPPDAGPDGRAARLTAHLEGLHEIECAMTGVDAPWRPTPSEERRVAIMARAFADLIEASQAGRLTRLAVGLKRFAIGTKRLEEAR
jgi:hypothetical protein